LNLKITNLFETILIKNRVAQHLAWHLQRLESSANTLGIALSIESAQRVVQEDCVDCDKDFQYRLRLNLASDGTLSYQIATLDPLTEKVKIFWASDLFDQPAQARMHSGNILLQHKVSHREIYDRAWQLAVSRGGFDALFTNEQGFVTEGGRSSVFIKPKGSQEWLTPPLSAGVLPGVMRSIILKDPKWNAREANLSVADLVNAEEIMLSNALRGTISAYF
jgi:para-aminobenzoate synthetase/4-amino-4-deoxychorismate lyase